MSLFPTFFSRRSANRPGPLDDYWYSSVGVQTKAGKNVTESNALKYLSVLTCVTLVGGDIARLPFSVLQKNTDGSRGRATQHPLDDILHVSPNTETTSLNWRESKLAQLMLWGNSYDYIDRPETNGPIRQLWQLDAPGSMKVERLVENTVRLGPGNIQRTIPAHSLVYTYKNKITYLKSEIFHVAGFGLNGLVGMSMIALAREAIGKGLAAEEFQSKFFGSGTHPSIVVTIPSEVDLGENEEAYQEGLKKSIAGLKNAHGIAVFGQGEKVERLTMNFTDAQFLETMIDNRAQVAGIYHVPLSKLNISGSNTNYNNTEQENRTYVDSCLSHWTTRIEQAANHQLLSKADRQRGLYCNLELKGLLRGDTSARTEFYKPLLNSGFPLNRVLALEDMNPVKGGDQGYVQLNMIPIEDVGEVQKQKFAPKKETKSLPTIRETRSIQIRDRITSRYYPLIEAAARKLVEREASAVRAQVSKYRSIRGAVEDLTEWLNTFYNAFSEDVKEEMGPVFRSFSEAIMDAAIDEVGGVDDVDIDKFISDYIDRYAERHTDSSKGQLIALLRGEIEDLETRVGEWEETRPEKVSRNESVRMGNATFQIVVFAAGLRTVWRIRGAKTCPYCKELNGKAVASGESFVEDGDEINVEGEEKPMKIKGMKVHPPLHYGCDCFLSI